MMALGKDNDSSILINKQHSSVRAWAEPGMLNSSIDPALSDKWRSELKPSQVRVVSHFFAKRNYECYKEYDFKSLKGVKRVSMMPFYFRSFVRRYFSRKVYGFLKNY